ncbi:MAG: low molecular weight protein-tyrosine-phosphatase [Francisellaceae bacterium]
MFKRVLVVCVGNICRSPVACGLFKDRLRHIEFESAGLSALTGQPASPFSMQYVLKHGIDLSSHIARQLDETQLKLSDLILVMEEEHIAAITTRFPFTQGKVYLLGHWENKKEVYDPYGKDKKAYERMVEEIYTSVEQWQKRI